jgi:DNA-binding YbaB/EbfC family protein
MDLMRMMKQAQDLQQKMQDMQSELDRVEVEGSSGGGLMRVRMTAKGDLKGVTIDPTLMKSDEAEILEDLLVAAHADARRKGEALVAERMKSMTGGLQLPPGMKLPF